MTPDYIRQRSAIDRAHLLRIDADERQQAEHAELLRIPPWCGILMCAAAGAYCLYTLIAVLVTP